MSSSWSESNTASAPFVPARLSWDVLLCYVLLGAGTTLVVFVDIPVFAQMSVSTLLLLYIGSHLSLHAKHHSEDEPEVLEAKDASMFPIFGGIMLVSLYLVFKFLPKEYVDVIVSLYFFLIGFFGLASTLKTVSLMALSHDTFDWLEATNFSFHVPMFVARFFFEAPGSDDDDDSNGAAGDSADQDVDAPPARKTRSVTAAEAKKEAATAAALQDLNKVTVSALDVPCHIVAAIVAVTYLKTKHWITNNVFGMAFSIQGIALLNLDTFATGAILLVGLFVYDIFFVFATDVMVTVATKFDAPIKLLFPRAAERPSLLGLGDIVIPGIFISLMLRLDHTLYCHSPSFKKPYFWSCMIGYFGGLSMTVYVMYAFNHAQPALLYLVPACLLSVIMTAIVRGEFKTLISFHDHPVKREEHQHTD